MSLPGFSGSEGSLSFTQVGHTEPGLPQGCDRWGDAGGPAPASPGPLLLPDRRMEPHSQRQAPRRGTCLGTPGPVPKGAAIQFGAWPQSQASLIMTLPRSPWALMLDVSLGEDRGHVPLSSLGNFMAVS